MPICLVSPPRFSMLRIDRGFCGVWISRSGRLLYGCRGPVPIWTASRDKAERRAVRARIDALAQQHAVLTP